MGICVIVGLLYGYRAITMIVTVLPSANPEYHCDNQLNHTISSSEVLHRVVKIMSGFGLSINGQHVYCGDFIFSGHTMILILCYMVLVAALVALACCHHRGGNVDGVQGALHH